MKKSKWIVALMLLGGLSWAEAPADAYKNCHCYISTTKLANTFPFTDEQKPKVAVLLEAYQQMRSKNNQLNHDIKQAYKLALSQEPIDEAKLKDLVDQEISVVSERMRSWYNMEIEMYKLLSAEQKKHWHELFDTELTP